MKPRVTISIPVYNVEKYLARCLDSVLGQRVSCSCNLPDVYTLAAADGEKKAVIVCNYSNDTHKDLELNLDDSFTVYLLDESRYLVKTHKKASKFQLRTNQIALIKNY